MINIFAEPWTGQCVVDSKSKRLLPTQIQLESLTPAKCIKACSERGFLFAGVQYYFECFCGNVAPPQDRIVHMTQCSADCVGDKTQKCGGHSKMNVYEIAEKVCPESWTEKFGNCYKKFSPQDWSDADPICTGHGVRSETR